MEEGTWLCLRWVQRGRGRNGCDEEEEEEDKRLAEKLVIICSGKY